MRNVREPSRELRQDLPVCHCLGELFLAPFGVVEERLVTGVGRRLVAGVIPSCRQPSVFDESLTPRREPRIGVTDVLCGEVGGIYARDVSVGAGALDEVEGWHDD